jgi:lysophospholipase L1-like esterase
MKRLLIIGDSLAGGLPHLSFPAALEKGLRGWQVKASAVGGDTLAGVNRRLTHLPPEYEPDALIIEAGTNDILLPVLEQRGWLWKRLVERIESRGSVPAASIGAFRELYSRTIEAAKRCAGDIIVTTIACLGEDRNSEPNRIRLEYNEVIREVAGRYGVALAGVDNAFGEVMAKGELASRYFLDDLSGLFLDTLRCLTPRSAYQLSGRRGLVLTIDGVHLNPYGARTFAETIQRVLE